jgi:hypothetical protein
VRRIAARSQAKQISDRDPKGKWTGSVAESVKHLLCLHEHLSSHHSSTNKKVISIV